MTRRRRWRAIADSTSICAPSACWKGNGAVPSTAGVKSSDAGSPGGRIGGVVDPADRGIDRSQQPDQLGGTVPIGRYQALIGARADQLDLAIAPSVGQRRPVGQRVVQRRRRSRATWPSSTRQCATARRDSIEAGAAASRTRQSTSADGQSRRSNTPGAPAPRTVRPRCPAGSSRGGGPVPWRSRARADDPGADRARGRLGRTPRLGRAQCLPPDARVPALRRRPWRIGAPGVAGCADRSFTVSTMPSAGASSGQVPPPSQLTSRRITRSAPAPRAGRPRRAPARARAAPRRAACRRRPPAHGADRR